MTSRTVLQGVLSKQTEMRQHELQFNLQVPICKEMMYRQYLQPVLSKLLSAKDSGYLATISVSMSLCEAKLQRKLSIIGDFQDDVTYSFRMELTTARVNGEHVETVVLVESDDEAIVEN